jgi:hypothetical protein
MFSEDPTTWDSIKTLIEYGDGGFGPNTSPPIDPCVYFDDHNYGRF